MMTYMVMPYCEHDLDGILQNPLVRLNPSQIKSYVQQLLYGMEYLHKSSILHRDVKSANILISSNGFLKVADFGLSRPYSKQGGKYTNKVVTLWNRPPELLLGETQYDASIDLWGVGCVFGEILKRRAILPGSSELDQLNLIWNLLGTPNNHNWPGKTYLMLPLFKMGVILDFDENEGGRNYQRKTLGIEFPEDKYLRETYNLLDDLLQLCPSKRLTATQALNSEYFNAYPPPARAGTLDFGVFSDSHELDSKRLRDQRLKTGKHLILPTHYDANNSRSTSSIGNKRLLPDQDIGRSLKPFN